MAHVSKAGITATIALAIVVLPASCATGESDGRATAALNPAPRLGDFVLYAQRSVSVGAFTDVDGGDVGVGSVAAPGVTSQLVVGDHAEVEAAHNLIAPTVSLGAHAAVGDVQTTTLSNAGATLGQEAGYPSPMPLLPLAGPSPVGSDVVVPDHASRALASGAYGSLTVGDHATVTLAAGAYSFASVSMSPHAELDGAGGAVTIAVGGALSIADHDNVGPAHADTAGKLAFLVAGGDASASATAVSIGEHASVTAVIAAPNGTVSIGAHAHATGAFVGFDVATADHVLLDFQDGFTPTGPGTGAGSQLLHGYAGNPTDGTFPLAGPPAADVPIYLAVGLPVRDGAGLAARAASVSDPKDPGYRGFVSTTEFKATYAPADADYATVKAWASAAGLTIVDSLPNNILLGVRGTPSTIAAALHANLVTRSRMDRSGTTFVTVDREPSIDLSVPVLWIGGLDDYKVPATAVGCGGAVSTCDPGVQIDLPVQAHLRNGTGTEGRYLGGDIREAYLGGPGGPLGASCLTWDGTGQRVGLLLGDGVLDSDIVLNQPSGGSVTPTVQVAYGSNPGTSATKEATLDIAMVNAMAPAAQLFLFFDVHDAGYAMLTLPVDPAGHVVGSASTSFLVSSDDNIQQSLLIMAVQGTSFFAGSGDYGDVGDPGDVRDLDGVTLVGGTFLSTNPTTSGPGGSTTYPSSYYVQDNTWNGGCPFLDAFVNDACTTCGALEPANEQMFPGKDLSGGGVMDGNVYTQMFPGSFFTGGGAACECFPAPGCCQGPVPIPAYQIPVMARSGASSDPNGGSLLYRNLPDVALVASDLDVVYNGADTPTAGTSAASPLWAGFVALVNQAAEAQGQPPLGFANPVLYDIAATMGEAGGNDLYSTSFNDVADHIFNGNNLEGYIPCDGGVVQGFASVRGYDLVTGLGTPTCGLIGLLSSSTPLTRQTFQNISFHIDGGVQGPGLDSTVTATVFDAHGIEMCAFPLKAAGDGSWDNGTSVNFDFVLNAPFCPPRERPSPCLRHLPHRLHLRRAE